MKWYLSGEPRLSAFTWGHRPRIWVPFKELIKASSQGPPSEPAGPGELKGDSRPPAPFTLMCVQAQTRSGSASWMSPQLGVENSQVTSICGNVSSSPCRERLARTGYQHRGCWQDTDPRPARRKDLGFGLRRVTRLGDLRGVRRFRHGSFCSSENSLLSAGGNRGREGGEGTSTGCSSRTPRTILLPASPSPQFHLGTTFPPCFHPPSAPGSPPDQGRHFIPGPMQRPPQPSPCTPTLASLSQLLHICQRALSTTLPDHCHCPASNLQVPPNPPRFELTLLPRPTRPPA